MARSAALLLCLLLVIGCENTERLNRLEKQNTDLKAELESDRAARALDLQAKCAKDSRMWFNGNWQHDKDTMLLQYTNHYNKGSNSCVIEVEYHFSSGANASHWTNDITVWNVYENSQLAAFDQSHSLELNEASDGEVFRCQVQGQKCTTLDQFNALVNPLMSN